VRKQETDEEKGRLLSYVLCLVLHVVELCGVLGAQAVFKVYWGGGQLSTSQLWATRLCAEHTHGAEPKCGSATCTMTCPLRSPLCIN